MACRDLRVKGAARSGRSFLVFGRPLIGEEEIAEMVDTLRSGWIGFGPKCLRFEEDFARYVHADHARLRQLGHRGAAPRPASPPASAPATR